LSENSGDVLIADTAVSSIVTGPVTLGTDVVIVPTRTQLSAGTSPSQPWRWVVPSANVTVAIVRTDANASRRSEITCTSSFNASPGTYVSRGRSATTMTGAHAATNA
jgi:hypothetical protein